MPTPHPSDSTADPRPLAANSAANVVIPALPIPNGNPAKRHSQSVTPKAVNEPPVPAEPMAPVAVMPNGDPARMPDAGARPAPPITVTNAASLSAPGRPVPLEEATLDNSADDAGP